MGEFLFNPVSLPYLCQVILSLAISLYLVFGVREKSRATWWLILHIVASCLHYASGVYSSSGRSPERWLFANMIAFPTGYLAALGALGFAYEFLGNPFRRESKIVLWFSAMVSAALTIHLGFLTAIDLRDGVYLSWSAWKWGTLFAVVVYTWVLIVHLRQTIDDPTHSARGWKGALHRVVHPPTPAAQAHRAFSVISILLILIMAVITLRNLGLLPLSVGTPVFAAGYLTLLLATLLIFVNYAPVPSTFQVKLVGLSLFSVLAFLGSTSLLLFPNEELARDSGITTPSHSRLQFKPTDGGYWLSSSEAQFEDDPGEQLRDSKRPYSTLDLGFEFPFGEREWRQIYVYDEGLIAFDSTMRRSQDIAFPRSLLLAESPWIAPLIVPGAMRSVYARRDSGRAVLTWMESPDPASPRVQAALYADGRIIFDYGAPRPFDAGLFRGVSSGDPRYAEEVRFDLISSPVTYSAATFFQDYAQQVARFAHTRTSRLFWLILAASAFILGFFPFFYRGSLVRPLERLLAGVRRVNDGDLKTEVPVTVRDEIGLLTNQFNRMTRSLRRADEDLRTYADTLEQRVEERTVELAEKNQALETTLSELKATQAQLVQQEKLASLGALTAGIAHEIKNPLNFVNNFAGLTAELADELDESLAAYPAARTDIEDVLADLRLNARKIAEHGQRADGIVRSMLEHSRGSKGERQATDLNALLEEYVNLAYHGMRAQNPGSEVTIERDYDASIGRVELVPQEMGRVFLNLLNNAFQAVDEGERAPTVRVSTHRADSHVEIRVADNGPGIPEAIRAKVFEPFFTTKPAGSGTGLGLSLSHEIVVKGHGGSFGVESEEGRGATFIVALPVERTTTTPSSPLPHPQ